MRAIVFTGEHQVEVQALEFPTLEAGELLVEIAYSCISPGTELRCLSGQQAGLTFPFIPGYTQSGVVVETGRETSVPVGTRVFCKGTSRANIARGWGGHVSHAIVKEVSVYPLSDNIDLLDASAIKLAAIAYHGLRHSRPLLHERVAVVGLGPIGQFAARLHALTGANVVAFDMLAERVALAEENGVRGHVVEGDLLQAILSHFPSGADVIVDATGAVSLLPLLIGAARDVPWDDSLAPASRYLIQGSYPGDMRIPYQEAFLKEIQFAIPRDEQPRDIRAIIGLMERGVLRMRDLISVVVSPDEAPTLYHDLEERKPGLLTGTFQWH